MTSRRRCTTGNSWKAAPFRDIEPGTILGPAVSGSFAVFTLFGSLMLASLHLMAA
jgi:hypothetical protein